MNLPIVEDKPTPGFKEFYRPRKWLSVSDLLSYRRCPRHFFFGTGVGLGGAEGDHPALEFGEAIHAGLPITMTKGIVEGYHAFEEVWGKERYADDKRNNASAFRILQDFSQCHQSHNTMYDLIEPPPSAIFKDRVNKFEIPFILDVGGHVPLVGRMDGLCRLRSTGKLYVLEYKTTSETSARFFTAFDLNCQKCCYTLAGRIQINPDIEGAILEALRVSKTNSDTQGVPIPTSNLELEWFVKWVLKMMAEIKVCEDKMQFDPDWSGCHPYGLFGCPGYQCGFARLCKVEDWTPYRGLYRLKPEREYEKWLNPEYVEPRSTDSGKVTGPSSVNHVEQSVDIF